MIVVGVCNWVGPIENEHQKDNGRLKKYQIGGKVFNQRELVRNGAGRKKYIGPTWDNISH